MLYYALGDAILSGEEYSEDTTRHQITDFFANLSAGRTPANIRLPTGMLTPFNLIRGLEIPGQPVEFPKIGIGKPLSIMIREIYTGKYPGGGLFGNKKDLLVTSAIKSITSFDAKPRAVNFLQNDISAKYHLFRPSASQQGTPLVFYSPALIERALTLDLTMVFDSFPNQAFETLGGAFQTAAGIPIFLAQSVYLLAAGAIAKIAGSLGEALFDGKPVFSASEPLDIYLPGTAPLQPGFAIITDGNVDNIDKDFRATYSVNSTGKVVDSSGKSYDGEAPYIVISYDGTATDEYASFAPTAASVAILTRFFGMKDGQAQPIDSLLDAVKLYNDFTYRQEIDKVDKQLGTLPEGKEKEDLKKKREALAKNILTDLLKKP